MAGLFDARSRFERRIMLFHLAAFLLLLALGLRLMDLQWLQHEGLLLQAEQNRINVVPILPTRGEITDRDGRGLAVNHVSYGINMIPERVHDMGATLNVLQEALNWSDSKLENIRQRLRHSRADRPMLVDDKLNWISVAPLAATLHRYPGVDVFAGTHRYYPYAAMTSHVIGYLSLASPEDVQKGYLPNEKLGRTGAERIFEQRLHGKPGSQLEEVDATGRRIRVIKRLPPAMGDPIRLSLDVDLQEAAARAIGGRTGAAVVLDVHTGEVLALASTPGFDSNQFISGLEVEQWQQWLRDKRKPLLNRATQAAIPPASTFKLLTALAGLRADLPLTRRSIVCTGKIQLADRQLRCWKREGHGHIDLHRAIVESCDVYFYQLGEQLGIERLRAEANLWGLGETTGIALTPEAMGLAPGQRWRGDVRRQKWYQGETMIAAIGQGAVTETPLQMARIAAAIANGGLLLTPQLQAGAPPVVARQIEVNEADLQAVRRAMRDVVADVHGTAHASLAGLPVTVAGKTGTAQVVMMGEDEESPKEVARHHRDHAWFMGYAPAESPHIAFAVLIEHGGHGGSAAAPVAAHLVQAWAAKDKG